MQKSLYDVKKKVSAGVLEIFGIFLKSRLQIKSYKRSDRKLLQLKEFHFAVSWGLIDIASKQL